MPSDLETQVAETKCPGCPCCQLSRTPSTGAIPGCNDTGLRFPSLSRECPGNIPTAYISTGEGHIYNLGYITDHEYPKGTVYHCRSINVMKWRTKEWLAECKGGCLGIGRIPDVTLEKVLDAAHQEGPTVFLNVMAAIGAWYSGHSEQDNSKDVACAALLASTSQTSPAPSTASL